MDDTTTRLTLVTPARFAPEDFLPRLESALSAGEIAAVILDIAADAPGEWADAATALCPAVQGHGAAFLIRDHAELARQVGADGIHVVGDSRILAHALDTMRPDFVVGAGDCTTRHAAMMRGERDPDYVLLGRLGAEDDLPASVTLVEWWSGLFQIPGVALAAGNWDIVDDLSRAGAEFLALRDLVWRHPDGPAAAIRRAGEAARLPGEVAA